MRRSHVLAPALTLAAVTAVTGPRPLRRGARRAVVVYALTLAAGAAAVGLKRRRPDAAGLPLVLATMHLSWGTGFLAGCARFGPPLEALRRLPERAGPDSGLRG